MPHLLENVFTADAVQAWSPIVRQAWLERKTDPDGYLRSLPPPGQRLATGPWSAEEEATFEQRLNEFRQNNWPISYWGIFSLALPHRTGSQCRHYYRHSPWYLPKEEDANITLAAVRLCLEKHKPTLSTLWTSPIALQIQTRVDAWLRGERSPTSEPSIIAIQQAHSALPRHQNKQKLNSGAPRKAGNKNLPLAELKQESKQHQKNKNIAGNKRPVPIEAAEGRTTSKGSFKKQKNTTLGNNYSRSGGSGGGVKNDEDSEDEFIAGTLRKVKTVHYPATVLPDSTTDTTTNKPSSDTGKAASKGKRRAPHRRRPALLANGTAAVAIQHEFDEEDMERMNIIRLDREKNLPGWVAREVKPYCPPLIDNLLNKTDDASASIAEKGSKILFTKDILAFDFASLGSETITGVIINAPLSEHPHHGITINQLTTLGLADCLASDAIVCIWATKEYIGQAATCMTKAWGCKYVENLTWVHIAPNGDVAKGPSTLTRTSHSTLLMGRRGGGELELRHQRSPDVIVEPVRGGGKFPDTVREMMETLLPESKHAKQGKTLGGKATQQQQQEKEKKGGVKSGARFLEISFHGAEPGVRPGWVKLVQV